MLDLQFLRNKFANKYKLTYFRHVRVEPKITGHLFIEPKLGLMLSSITLALMLYPPHPR